MSPLHGRVSWIPRESPRLAPLSRPASSSPLCLDIRMKLRVVSGLLAIGLAAGPAIFSPASASVDERSPKKVAVSNLINAGGAAVTYFVENGRSFKGFDAATAAGIEPAITWADGDAVSQNVVNIGKVNAKGTRVMLETSRANGPASVLAARPDTAWWKEWTRTVALS